MVVGSQVDPRKAGTAPACCQSYHLQNCEADAVSRSSNSKIETKSGERFFMTPQEKAERDRLRRRRQRILEAVKACKKPSTFDDAVAAAARAVGESPADVRYELMKLLDETRLLLEWQAYEAGVPYSAVLEERERGTPVEKIIEELHDLAIDRVHDDARKYRALRAKQIAGGKKGAILRNSDGNQLARREKIAVWQLDAVRLQSEHGSASKSAIAKMISRRFRPTALVVHCDPVVPVIAPQCSAGRICAK